MKIFTPKVLTKLLDFFILWLWSRAHFLAPSCLLLMRCLYSGYESNLKSESGNGLDSDHKSDLNSENEFWMWDCLEHWEWEWQDFLLFFLWRKLLADSPCQFLIQGFVVIEWNENLAFPPWECFLMASKGPSTQLFCRYGMSGMTVWGKGCPRLTIKVWDTVTNTLTKATKNMWLWLPQKLLWHWLQVFNSTIVPVMITKHPPPLPALC